MVELKHPVDADFPNSQRDGCSLGADSDFALLFVAAQFALKVDVTPLEIVPAKSASFPKATNRCRSLRDSHPPTSFCHDVLVGEGQLR